MAAHPFRERVDDDVRAVVQRAGEVGRAECGVHHERDAVFVGDGGDGFDVGDIQAGVADGFAEEELGFRRDGFCEVLRVLRVNEADLDPELGEDVVELCECAAIEVVRRDDLVARGADVDDRVEDRAGAGSQCQCGCAALEFRDALLEHIVGGVHEAGVDVAQLAEAEEVRGVLGVAEDIRAGAVEGHRAGHGGGIGGGTPVEADGFEFHGFWKCNRRKHACGAQAPAVS